MWGIISSPFTGYANYILIRVPATYHSVCLGLTHRVRYNTYPTLAHIYIGLLLLFFQQLA